MAARIVEWALANRFLVLVLGLLLVLVGIWHMQRVPIDAVPDVTNVQVQVLTEASALGPLEVERLVTFPVESAMAGIPDVEEVRSVSKFGLSSVTVVFEEGTDIYRGRQLVQERLADAREAIPEGYGAPELGPIATGLGEIYQFEVGGEPRCPIGEDRPDCWSPMELRTILDWFVAYQLKSVPGVVEVNTFGGELQTYEVAPDPNVLRAHGLSLGDLFEALEQNNRNVGGAYLVRNREQVVIRGEGLLAGLTDIENVVLRAGAEGTPLYVRDVAKVHLAPRVRQGVVTRDGGGEAVVGVVMMLMGENPREVVQRVEERLDNLRDSLPEGVTIDTFYDRTELVDRTIHTVERNLFEGGLLVVAVLLLMLGNLRGGLVVALAIPLSMLFAFIGMVQAGVSGNLMSLGAIDFGLIVDGAVVMVENVYRRMDDPAARGHSQLQVVLDACREVARPVAFAVGIIMIVYLPILTLTGVEGKMFRPMALTVLFALAGSLVLAFTVIPVLGSFVLARPRHHETWLVARIRAAYEPLLDRAMNRRGVVVAAAVGLLATSGVVASTMGTEFIPQLDEGAVALEVRRLPSVSVDEAAQQTLLLERVLLRAFPTEIRTIVSKTGRPEIATDPMGVEMSDVFVLLKPTDEWRFDDKAELVEAMEDEVAEKVPGLAVGFSQPIQLRVSELIVGVRSDVAIKVFGEDLDVLLRVGEQIARVVTAIDGAEDVKVEQVSGLPVLTARIDRTATARYGVRGEDIFGAIEALGGRRVGLVYEGEKRFDLQVRLPPEVRNDEDAIAALPIATSAGRLVPLGELTSLDTREAAAQISRERIQRRIGVEVNVRGRDIGSFVEEARRAIHDDVDLPAGYTIEWGGQFENLERAAARLTLVVPLALLLIFVLLYGAFDSARPAALIFLNVPFAATGGVLALALRGMPLSISAGVGFIALFGVAVMNGVVLLSFVRELERQGRSPREAAREGARARMRPVLMTALVAAIGFFPMALGHGAGAEVQRPLATVVIGGLVTSTLLTLFVLPSIYEWFAERPTTRLEPSDAEPAVVPIARS
jgi:cobalt-zinc-cadmium resistance protein CzcA